jgi:hypothetical protein
MPTAIHKPFLFSWLVLFEVFAIVFASDSGTATPDETDYQFGTLASFPCILSQGFELIERLFV